MAVGGRVKWRPREEDGNLVLVDLVRPPKGKRQGIECCGWEVGEGLRTDGKTRRRTACRCGCLRGEGPAPPGWSRTMCGHMKRRAVRGTR